jgi:hypothetical protein
MLSLPQKEAIAIVRECLAEPSRAPSRGRSTRELRSINSLARDHLFISYATEDGAFAEWLTLKLTALGYKVWCDRFKLFGGESYPTDNRPRDQGADVPVPRAALSAFDREVEPQEGAHARPQPRAAAERGVRNPANLDGLNATDLDWMNADLTFVPFHPGKSGDCPEVG